MYVKSHFYRHVGDVHSSWKTLSKVSWGEIIALVAASFASGVDICVICEREINYLQDENCLKISYCRPLFNVSSYLRHLQSRSSFATLRIMSIGSKQQARVSYSISSFLSLN